MSDTDNTHVADDGHGQDHDHAPAGEPLGPVDLVTWAYAAAGALLGLLVVVALYLARGA